MLMQIFFSLWNKLIRLIHKSVLLSFYQKLSFYFKFLKMRFILLLLSHLISSIYFNNLRYNVLRIVWKTQVYHYDPHHEVPVKNFRFHTWLVVIRTQKGWISSIHEKISFIYRRLYISFSHILYFLLCVSFFILLFETSGIWWLTCLRSMKFGRTWLGKTKKNSK